MAMVWATHLEGGPRRVNHAAALVGNSIYSFGGYCTGDDFKRHIVIDVHVLCTVTNRWKKLNPPTDPDELKYVPFQRYGHTAVSYGSNIYIWGGRNDEVACNKLFCFDTVSEKWSCPEVFGGIPGARDGHTSCIINDTMYVLGGFIDDIDEYAEGLHALDLTTMRWHYVYAKGVMPSYRDFHAATAVNGKMYVFGGRGHVHGPYHTRQEIYNNTLYIYDPEENCWTRKENQLTTPIGRRSLATFAHENRLYMFGGYNSTEKMHYNDLYYFDVIRNEWSPELETLGERPCKRRRHCCVVVHDRVFLFGGTSPRENGPITIYDDDDEELPHDRNLMDHDDLYVLDLKPSLRTLCLVAVIKFKLNWNELPHSLQCELAWMTKHNIITKPLPRSTTG